jgi:hypothetical protein
MKLRSVLGASALVLSAACSNVTFGTSPGDQPTAQDDTVVDTTAIAGANQNDRSLAKDGDDLQTGAMVVSPSGRYVVMQRNTETLVYDASAAAYHVLPQVLDRIAFAKHGETVFAFSSSGANGPAVLAIDLASRATVWSTPLASADCKLLRGNDDDTSLLVGAGNVVHSVDAKLGTIRGTTSTDLPASNAAFVPGTSRALVVGQTSWYGEGPHTLVYTVDLSGTAAVTSVDVPNCEAPIAVTPNGARAFLSPTYCTPGASATPGETWTNPDPVSVIDLAATGATFVKNLPGFGPVAMAKDGSRVVAYLDVKRMDPAMFTDQKQVPWVDGQRYHLMTIDPSSLTFQLAPIGNAIPRFALTADGRGLLVDASAKITSRTVIAARAEVSIGPDGVQASAEANVDIFGSSSAFGYFDLNAQSFTAFSGVDAPLDRFVQFADGRHVLTLGKRVDGLGGTPFMIDLTTKSTWAISGNFGSGVRDVGLSADGMTALLRLRMPANVHDGGFYSREGLCVSTDGSCGATLTATFEDDTPFAMVPPTPAPEPVPECPESHDCW